MNGTLPASAAIQTPIIYRFGQTAALNVHCHPSWREAWLPESEAKKNPSTSLLGIFSSEKLSLWKYAERKSMLDRSIATHPPKNAASIRTEILANREKSRSSVRMVGAPCSRQTAAICASKMRLPRTSDGTITFRNSGR